MMPPAQNLRNSRVGHCLRKKPARSPATRGRKVRSVPRLHWTIDVTMIPFRGPSGKEISLVTGGGRVKEAKDMQGIRRLWLVNAPVSRSTVRLAAILLLLRAVFGIAQPASSAPPAESPKQPTATGTGGAVATVDHDASKVGMQVLDNGGNAVDAAVATAAALGVTEPYSCGIGGGGFMVVYRASDGSVSTIESRETAPAAFQPNSFIDPKTGQPIPFNERVTSGLGVGVPGTIRGWEQALGEFWLKAALGAATTVHP